MRKALGIHEGYIVALDTGGCAHSINAIASKYPPESIVKTFLPAEYVANCGLWMVAMVVAGETRSTARAIVSDAYFDAVRPVLKEVKKRGYLPGAIIGCPYLVNALLYGIKGTPGLEKMGFAKNAPIVLNFTTTEGEYTDDLPHLMGRKNLMINYQPSARNYNRQTETDARKNMQKAFEIAGVMPEKCRVITTKVPTVRFADLARKEPNIPLERPRNFADHAIPKPRQRAA